MSRKKPNPEENLFATIPPQETFDAFPATAAFPEGDIAFLTGRAPSPEAVSPKTPDDALSPAARKISPQTRQKAKLKATQPASQPRSKPVSKPVSQPDNRTANRTASHTASQSAGLQTSPIQGQTQSHTGDQSQDHSKSRTQGPSLSQSPGLSPRSMRLAERLNANQRRVLELLLAAKPYIIRFREVGQAAGLGEASARTIMRRLENLGFLTFRKARDGNLQGVRIAFNQQLVEEYLQSLHSSQSPGHSPGLTASLSKSQSQDLIEGHTPSQPVTQPASLQASQSPPLQIDRNNSLSIQSVEEWDDALIALMWPKVHEAGLRLEQLTQAAAARAKLGKGLDPELVRVSLDRAQWELEEKGCLADLASGKEVRSAPAYIYTALARWGTLRAHPDYVSREEVEAKAAAEEARHRKEAAELLEDQRFHEFMAGLSPEALEEAMRGHRGGPREAWLKFVWRSRRGETDSGQGPAGQNR